MSIQQMRLSAPGPDRVIAALAQQQHGLVTRVQLLEAGLTIGAIWRRRQRGQLVDVHRGVYRIGGAPETREQRYLAACLAAGEGAVLSHRTAAHLWGGWSDPTPLEITTVRESGPAVAGVQCHRSRDVAGLHIARVGVLPVTSPVRTLVDLGQVAHWKTVRIVLDRFLAKKLVTPESVQAGVAMHSRRGRRGIGPIRRALASAGMVSHPDPSWLARHLVRLCADAGLPAPSVEHRVTIDGSVRFIDLAFPRWMLAVEVDGYEFHSSPAAFEEDRIRGNELTLLGWSVVRFTWQQLVHDPEYVVGVLRRLLATPPAASGHR